MSPAEHYAEAERLLALKPGPLAIAQAQVHATLATASRHASVTMGPSAPGGPVVNDASTGGTQ